MQAACKCPNYYSAYHDVLRLPPRIRPTYDGDAMTAASSFAPSSQRSSGRVVTDADSSPEKVVGLEERRSKRSAVVRLASAPLLDVADEPLSP